ncbi:MAG: hypothetical protein ACYCY5_11230 [Sulfuricella sp.]
MTHLCFFPDRERLAKLEMLKDLNRNQCSRADERSVIRRMYAAHIFHSADNGLRPHPPYAGWR